MKEPSSFLNCSSKAKCSEGEWLFINVQVSQVSQVTQRRLWVTPLFSGEKERVGVDKIQGDLSVSM